MSSYKINVVSYPDEKFFKQCWAEGGAQELRDSLYTFWFSPIELTVNNHEVLRSLLDARWHAKLAIPVGDFWDSLETVLIGAINGEAHVEKTLSVSHGVEDSLVLKAVRTNDGGYFLGIMDTQTGELLVDELIDVKALVEAARVAADSINDAVNALVSQHIPSRNSSGEEVGTFFALNI